MSNEIPRRARLDQMHPAELAIRESVVAIESMGCDARLTAAQILLQQAKDLVSNYIDNVDVPKEYVETIHKRAPINFIVFSSDDEVIVTTPEMETLTTDMFFAPESGRDLDEYDRQESSEDGVVITARMHTN